MKIKRKSRPQFHLDSYSKNKMEILVWVNSRIMRVILYVKLNNKWLGYLLCSCTHFECTLQRFSGAN